MAKIEVICKAPLRDLNIDDGEVVFDAKNNMVVVIGKHSKVYIPREYVYCINEKELV